MEIQTQRSEVDLESDKVQRHIKADMRCLSASTYMDFTPRDVDSWSKQ
jgi:hypothetical protein